MKILKSVFQVFIRCIVILYIAYVPAIAQQSIHSFIVDLESGNSLNLGWKAYYSTEKTGKIFYSVNDDYKVSKESGFYFPEYTPFDSALTIGYNPFITAYLKIPSLELEGTFKVWEKDFTEPLINRKDSISLYQRIYCENLPEYYVAFYSSAAEEWFVKKFQVDFEGYQIPAKSDLSSWQKVKTKEDTTFTIFNDIPDSTLINKMMIYYLADNEKAKLELGEFYIAEFKYEDALALHPFFDKLLPANNLNFQKRKSYNAFTSLPGLSILFATETQYLSMKMGNAVYFKREEDSASEVELLAGVLFKVLIDYTFYKEREINRDSVFIEYKKILAELNDSTNIETFSKYVEPLIKKFKDPHFTIFIPRKDGKYLKEVPGPVRVFGIDDKVLVAAVFDDSLKKQISLGDEIIKVNGRNVIELVEEGLEDHYGTSSRKRNKSISRLLFNEKTDSTYLTVLDDQQKEKEIKILYNKPYEIPSNFNPVHCGFNFDSDSIAYFRISRWDNQLYIRFLNHIDKIKKSKGIIIDVRGNVGGSTFGAMKLTSLFINSPTVYNEVIPFREKESKESLVLKPNNKYYINKPVVILGDENTSCASEEFILGMKRSGKAIFVGSGKTAGTLAARHDFYLPSGIILSLNTVANKMIDRELGVVECKGIEPDIYIKRNSVYDLYPYNDKILLAAKKYLREQ